MDYNLYLIIGQFQGNKLLFYFLIFLCGTVYLQNFSPIPAVKNTVTLKQLFYVSSVGYVPTGNENKRVYNVFVVLLGI